jgi:hypothetical protein
LLESAAIDISNSAVQQSSVKCAKVTIEERDIGSKSKTRENTQYVALDEILQARPTIFKNQKKPVFVNEGFVSMENMNAGQRAFIGAATVIALYLYFKVVEK